MPYNFAADSFQQTFFKRSAILDGISRFAFLSHL